MNQTRSSRWPSILLRLIVAFALFAPLSHASAMWGGESIVYHVYHPQFLVNAYGITSTLSLASSGAVMANTAITLRSISGVIYSIFTGTLAPRQSLKIEAASLTGVPNGIYSLGVESDQPFESVVSIYRPNGNLLSIYRGMTSGSASPVLGPFTRDSGGVLQNLSATDSAMVTLQYVLENGQVINDPAPRMIPPGGINNFLASTNPSLPQSFTGMVVVQSTQPLLGLTTQMVRRNNVPMVASMTPALPAAGSAYLPRVLKGLDEGGGARSTTLFLGNTSGNPSTALLTFTNPDGSTALTHVVDMPAPGSVSLSTRDIPSLPGGKAYGVRMQSTSPVVFSEFTNFETVPLEYSAASYDGGVGQGFVLPRVTLADGRYSIVRVINTGAVQGEISLEVNAPDGETLYTTLPQTVARGGWVALDLRDITTFLSADPGGFNGSVRVISSEPARAVVDEFYRSCAPVTAGQLFAVPYDTVFADGAVQFTVDSDGAAPLRYEWSVNGAPPAEGSARWEHLFDAPGPQVVEVTVSNGCSAGVKLTHSLTVLPADAGLPDLSSSTISADPTVLEVGGTVELSVVLRNTGGAPAQASAEMPIPALMTYQPGSASASNGGAVSETGAALQWSGKVEPGSPVIITYRLTAGSIPSVGEILAQASIADGQGQVFHLMAAMQANPGFGIVLDGGALATADEAVDITYSLDLTKNIVAYNISTDAGFINSQGQGWTTGWFEVDPANPRYEHFPLDTSGDERLPCAVYIRFRDADGVEYGPFSDDILYDPVPPEILSLEQEAQAGLQTAGAVPTKLVTVQASDLVTGVETVELSTRADFASLFAGIPARGLTTRFVWNPALTGTLYVRVVDRSGNTSAVQALEAHRQFLPFATR